ncbi:hypothetical protein ACLPJK_26455 [Pseudomonas aeruginosa]|uniref:hypothetical protein n=1 Tax=Pseudomonas aeruginosa TaxID=287 RepID=UPI003D2DA025
MFKSFLRGIPLLSKVLLIVVALLSVAYCSKSKDLEIKIKENVGLNKDLATTKEQLKLVLEQKAVIDKLNADLMMEAEDLKEKFGELETQTRSEFAEVAGAIDSVAVPSVISGKLEAAKKSASAPEALQAKKATIPVVRKDVMQRAHDISIDALWKSYCQSTTHCKMVNKQ